MPVVENEQVLPLPVLVVVEVAVQEHFPPEILFRAALHEHFPSVAMAVVVNEAVQ
jgi:hypothetical protein